MSKLRIFDSLEIRIALFIIWMWLAVWMVYVITTPHVSEAQSYVIVPVLKVTDGDTIHVLSEGDKNEAVRIIGIDTPETVDPRKGVQCYGREASARAHQLLDEQWIALEYDQSQGVRDKYNRVLAYVILPDGRNYSEVMISEGYAREYIYNRRYRYVDTFKAAQSQARANGAGLWSACIP